MDNKDFYETFNQWNSEEWKMAYNDQGKLFLKKIKLNNVEKRISNDIEKILVILGKIDLVTNLEFLNNGNDKLIRIDYKSVLWNFCQKDFLEFDKYRKFLEEKKYINPSWVVYDFNVLNKHILHYEIGTLTPLGLELLKFTKGNHKCLKYQLFKIKKSFWWIATLGSIASIISLFIQLCNI